MISQLFDIWLRDNRAALIFIEGMARLKLKQFNNESIVTQFRKTVAKNGHKIAIKYSDQKWTFERLDQFSNKVGNYFNSIGFKAGDEVALMMNNKPEFIGIWLGLAKIGAITALINTNNRLDLLINAFKAIKCKAIIYDYEYNQAIDGIFDELMATTPAITYFVWSEYNINNNQIIAKHSAKSLAPELVKVSKSALDQYHRRQWTQTLLYIYTSGTTGGKVKAAIQSDGRMIGSAVGLSLFMGIKNSDNIYISTPLYHTLAIMLGINICLVNGTTITIADKFSASQFWSDCVRQQCTIALYIGEMCRYLLSQTPKPEDTRHTIRTMGGIGLRKEYWKQFKTRFAINRVIEYYSASEANVFTINFTNKEGACGFIPWYYLGLVKLLYSASIIRVDPITSEPIRNSKGVCKSIRPGGAGVLVGIHRDNDVIREFKGYTNEEETKKKLIRDVRARGDCGFFTGDMIRMDHYGYLYFVDRLGDTFRYKGENVSTTDVEAVIQSCLNLKDCMVFGVTVGQSEGKAGMAVINANSDEIDLQELAQQLSRRLPSYAIPLFIKLTADIEVTGTFKLIKYKLQNMGFTPQSNDDFIAVYDKNINSYKRMTNEIYESILSGEMQI